MTSCPHICTSHIPMFINQTVACVMASMIHRELTLGGCGWGRGGLCNAAFRVELIWLYSGSSTENMQLRRLWPVQSFAPCGQHRLGGQCKCWQLAKLEEAVRSTSWTPVTLNPSFSCVFCLVFVTPLPALPFVFSCSIPADSSSSPLISVISVLPVHPLLSRFPQTTE